MKFKLKKQERNTHQDIVSAVTWSGNNELFSVSDDMSIWKWNSDGEPESKLMDIDTPVLSMDWLPGKGSQETLALACSDGSFKLVSRAGRVEKSVAEAHMTAIICLKWSYEGTLATAGEDGQIKTWSRSGMLRAQVVQGGKPIYCLVWSPESDAILYCCDKNLVIEPTLPGNKQVSWKAHDGVVLACDWNPANNLIVSAGEDSKYRVWDQFGRQLYNSLPYDHVITSVKWAPNGEVFAVGSFEMLRLCDKSGWSHSFDKPQTGSILNMSWSNDGTILAGAGGSGAVAFGYIVDRKTNWNNIEAMLDEDEKITVTDYLRELNEVLDYPERVVAISIKFNFMIVATMTCVYVYDIKAQNWQTPHTADVRDAVSMIVQGAKYFAIIDASQNFQIYNYEGRLVSKPTMSGLRVEFLNKRHLSISGDVLALIDPTKPKIVRVFDIQSGKPAASQIEHSTEIIEMDLNQIAMASERKMCFIDSNRDMFLTKVHKPEVQKIQNMVDSFMWNESNDMLSCISDGKHITWFYPNAIYMDKDLMQKARAIREAPEVGKLAQMISFTNNICEVRRLDGGLATLAVSPYPRVLYEHMDKPDFEKAIRLCRFVKEQTLWACLAAMAIDCRELNTLEIALAVIDEADKVQYINYIKELPSDPSRNAALALYCKKCNEAEQILMGAQLFYRAIKMNIKLYRWNRALDIAINKTTHVDTVIAYRNRFLEQYNKEETNERFVQLSQEIQVDWETVKTKIKAEKQREVDEAKKQRDREGGDAPKLPAAVDP